MKHTTRKLPVGSWKALVAIGLMIGAVAPVVASDGPPALGDEAKDFELSRLDGKTVQLSKLLQDGPVVLVVLRGWPGYQCPICTKQVGELMAGADRFKVKKARVVLVYPGPAEGLKAHSEEFISGKSLPENFSFVVDPDYTFTKSYGLRWDARGETAYPSTFVIDPRKKITFAKISRSHGDRARLEPILEALDRK